MSELSAQMKFEIGDFVYQRDTPHLREARPKQFIITERLLQECPGGIQRQYRLNNAEGWWLEIVLSSTEPEFRPMSDAKIADEVRLITATRAAEREASKHDRAMWKDSIREPKE